MKRIYIIIGVVAIGGLITLAFLGTDTQPSDTSTTLPTSGFVPRPAAEAVGTRMVNSAQGFVPVRDISQNPVAVYPGEVTVFVDNADYSMLYYAQDDLFMVTLNRNFSSVRPRAEQAFLEQLNITREQACDLQVDLLIPPYVDFNRAGSYGLSYCPGSIELE